MSDDIFDDINNLFDAMFDASDPEDEDGEES